MHGAMTNDFFSFEKEVIESELHGGFVINAVRALEQTLHVSTKTAKSILQQIIWDLETKIHDFYAAALASPETSDQAIQYVRRMIECLAGNWYFSATTRRYNEPLVERVRTLTASS